MNLSDDYHLFMFAYLAHGFGLKAQKGIALNPQYSKTPILFTSKEMDILQVAANVVQRQPSFNAKKLKKELNSHQESISNTPPSIPDSEEDEDWYEDADLAKILPELPNQRHIYVDDGTKQNPYCITIANKRKLNEFQCEVWTLPELLKLDQRKLEEEFQKWRKAGFAASLPPSVIWDDLEERFKQHYFQYYPDEHKLTEMWNIAWTEYWLIVALFGKPKEIPQKLKDYQSKILNGQGLISSNADAEHLTEKDVLLGTQENFMEFIQKRCDLVED